MKPGPNLCQGEMQQMKRIAASILFPAKSTSRKRKQRRFYGWKLQFKPGRLSSAKVFSAWQNQSSKRWTNTETNPSLFQLTVCFSRRSSSSCFSSSAMSSFICSSIGDGWPSVSTPACTSNDTSAPSVLSPLQQTLMQEGHREHCDELLQLLRWPLILSSSKNKKCVRNICTNLSYIQQANTSSGLGEEEEEGIFGSLGTSPISLPMSI